MSKNSFKWFQSYLSGRNLRVKKTELSGRKEITKGVPQGSILILLYINDPANNNIAGNFTLFAYDTTILWNNKINRELQHIISSDLGKVKDWSDANL